MNTVDEQWLRRAVEMIAQHEGFVPWLYCCTGSRTEDGYVTVGYGYHIERPVDVDAVPLHWPDDSAADNDIKRQAWLAVRRHYAPGANLNAGAYKKLSHLRLDEKDARSILQSCVRGFADQLGRKGIYLGAVPTSAAVGIMDMAYSLGVRRLFELFPKFISAVRREDWGVCAGECQRRFGADPDAGSKRNADTKALFLDAYISAKAVDRIT